MASEGVEKPLVVSAGTAPGFNISLFHVGMQGIGDGAEGQAEPGSERRNSIFYHQGPQTAYPGLVCAAAKSKAVQTAV